MRNRALPYILLLGFLYGSTLVVSRFSVGQYAALTYISLRLILAAGAHTGVYLLSGLGSSRGEGRRWPRNRRLWRHAAVLGVIGTALPMTAIISSLQYQSSGVTSLLLTLNPAVTVVLAQLFLTDEQMTKRKVTGILIALAGAGVLLSRGETGLGDLGGADWRGYAWVALGIAASASAGIYARLYLRTEDSWDVASVRMLAAAIALIPVTYLTVGYDLNDVTAVGYGALVYAALVGTFFGMWLSFYVIKQFGATAASQTAYVIPVVSATLGALVLGEVVTTTMLIGMATIFAGIWLVNTSSASPRPRAGVAAQPTVD